MVSGLEWPEPVREEFRAFLRLVLENDDDLLDLLMANFTATLSGYTPKLAAYQWSLRWDQYRDDVRALYAQHEDAPNGRWWPEIVAGCLRLDAARTGHLPRPKDFTAIVRDTLNITDEAAALLVSFSNCDEPGNHFHRLWQGMASNGPGLDDVLKEAGL